MPNTRNNRNKVIENCSYDFLCDTFLYYFWIYREKKIIGTGFLVFGLNYLNAYGYWLFGT